MVGSAALYQVAIALVPALFFGGATLQLREGKGLPRSPVVGVGMALAIAAGVVAETIAIRGAIDPTISEGEQRYLVLTLALGTAGVAYWFAEPLLTNADGKDRVPFGRAFLALVLIGAAALGQVAITESLHRSEARVRFEEASKRRLETLRELRTAEGGDSRARERLIALARSAHSSDAAIRAIVAGLTRLDDRALTLARDEDLDADSASKVMKRAFAVLNDVDDRLERSFESRLRRLDEAERELLLLASRQLIAAVSQEMTSKANDTLAARDLESACEAADFLHCAGPAS